MSLHQFSADVVCPLRRHDTQYTNTDTSNRTRIRFVHLFVLIYLGFLNANPSPQIRARVANYGLMDQMAALHWVQQNINRFGGDPNAVTLAGHGSGAACINFLMTSPTMVPGLFHRAILLSGSAFSSWALVEDPVIYALKLAKEVNCSIPEDLIKNHEQIVDCLREVPLEDLYAADIQAPSFLTAFGPSVRNDPFFSFFLFMRNKT